MTAPTDRRVAAGTSRPTAGDLAELVRLPAVLSAPGDVLAGATAALGDRPLPPGRTARLVAASCALYLGGMALNDVADVDEDLRERPHRPIPSGRVTRGQASAVAHGATALGLALAATTGRRGLAAALPVAASVYAYDLGLKRTAVAPLSMAACRAADVLLGASLGDRRRAVPVAATVAAHTVLVTAVSTRETVGTSPNAVRAATAAGVGVAAVAGHLARDGDRAGLVAASLYAADQLREGQRAAADPTPATLQRFVGRGVLRTVPLQATFVGAAGRRVLAAGLLGAWALARRGARRRAVS